MEIEGKKCELLYGEDHIKREIAEIADEITDTFDQVSEPILLVGVLKGAVPFMCELMKHMKNPCIVEFIQVRSYDGIGKSDKHTVHFRPTISPTNKHIVIVEDIVDTGYTAWEVYKTLEHFNPASITMAALLDKHEARQINVPFLNFTAFRIPNHFVVGYGLDYNEEYRELRDIWTRID